MQEHALPHRVVVFVCVNRRAEGERVCCAARGGQEIRDNLKAMVKARGLQARVRVCQSGCMDRCEQGPNVMILPENSWLSGVAEADLPAILDRLAAASDV